MAIKDHFFNTLRGKIIISLIVLIILPVIFIVYRFYISSKDIVQLQLYQSNQIAVERKAAAMNELTSRIVKASNLIMNDPDMENFLRDKGDWMNEYESFNNFTNFQKKLFNVRDYFLDSDAYLALFDSRHFMFSTWTAAVQQYPDLLMNESWYQPTLELKGSLHWSIPYSLTEGGRSRDLIVMTRQLNSEFQRGYGMMFIGIPIPLFFYDESGLIDQRKSGIHSFILNENKLMLGDTDPLGITIENILEHVTAGANNIQRIKLGQQEYLVNVAFIPQLGWKLVQLMNQENFVAQLNLEKNKTISWVVVWFLLFVIAFIVLMIRFTGPFKHLVKSMNRVGKGEFNTLVQIKGGDEIAVLGRNFNKMVLRLQELIENLSIEQQRKQKAQFQALQAQINPHFLLNTLNSIKWMAILSNAEHVSQMITKLGTLLNFTMKNKEEFVTFREELEYLHVYLSLQKIRYHDEITIEMDIPDHLLEYDLLKFTLQPAVENSIIHGKRFPLRIDIRAEEKHGELLITIQDNGVGMSEEEILQVSEQLSQPDIKYSGIGIRNVDERIKLHFGGQYGMRISSKLDEGVCISLLVPLKRRKLDA